jgi:hypothetical protein
MNTTNTLNKDKPSDRIKAKTEGVKMRKKK